MFHLRLNKTIQDIASGMPLEVNVDDELSLGYFKTYLGLDQISNKPENIRRCGEFEKHDQFCMEVGKAILKHAFKAIIALKSTLFPQPLRVQSKLSCSS